MAHNGRRWTYRALAAAVASTVGELAGKGLGGPGVAALAGHNLADFWVKSLALRALGLHTIALPDTAVLARLPNLDLSCVVEDPVHHWPDLQSACAARGTPLIWCPVRGTDEAPADDVAPTCVPGGHILLSSGTTGPQKMVLMDFSIEPAQIAHRIRITEHDAHSVTSAFAYGPWTRGGYQAAITAWTLGATVVYDQDAPARTIRYPGLTHAIILPSMTGALLAQFPPGAPPLDNVRLISVGGPLTWKQASALRARISPRLYNGIAATETVTFVDTPIETPDDIKWNRIVPGFRVEVVGEDDRPLPPGQVGEVRVGVHDGPSGYYNDEAATRARFRHGFFYTGDLGVMREDGRLSLRGRLTDELNIGGEKFSPVPIEQRLKEALPVSDICLFSMPDAAGEEELHVILESEAPVPADVLAAAVKAELRGFVRARVHYAKVLPRNDMGKVIRAQARKEALEG